MPPGLDEDRRFMGELRRELVDIHYRWTLVIELYRKTAEQIRLIASFGGDLFNVVERALCDDLVIAVARFTDVNKGGKYRTVNLHEAMERFLDPAALTTAKRKISTVWMKIKDVRDRVLAHRDYALHVGEPEGAPRLEGLTYAELRSFIDDVTAMMNEVETAFDGKPWTYSPPYMMRGSWETIFDALGRAEKYDSVHIRALGGESLSARDFPDRLG